MTTNTYEFTAFSEDDLVQQGTIGGGLGEGETFVMPAGATTVISTTDDDSYLSGDKDDNAKDSSGQYAVVNGVAIPNEQVYVEKYFIVEGSDGKTYYLAEIEIEDYDAPGSGDDFFTFIGDVPPAGTTLTTVDSSNVKDGIAYADLGAGPMEGDSDPDGGLCITIEAEDMQDHGFKTVHGDKASDGELVKLEGHDGSLKTSFDGPSDTYDLTLFAQDESDGQSMVKIYIDGELVETITLDGDNNGGGSDDSGFSQFTIEGLHIPKGAEIEIEAWRDGNEFVRIDKIELKSDGDAPENEAPTFDNLPDDGIICVDENETNIINIDSTDPEGDSVSYSIVGGRDADMFEIDPHTGELSFKSAKDYENPSSGGGNNTYDVSVRVTDSEGNKTDKDLWVKVKDVDEPEPKCIVIEAEDMHLCGYSIEHNGDASGGANIKATGSYGIAETVFSGPDGVYDLSVFSMDENDGEGAIDIFINGQYVDTIWLDDNNDGGGGANSGSTFSEDVFQDLNLQTGDVISLVGYTNCSEFARIDKIELCQDGDTCPPDYMKLDFSGLNKGTTVSNQFEGVTITAQKAGDGAGSPNDAMIFDSNNPTGGDGDLGFNGLGNILIISEDGDASDPDDNAHGGTITFDFDAPSDLDSIKLLDIEENGGSIKLYDADGNLVKTVSIPAAGNNSIQTIDLSAADISSMEIHLAGSGAVDDLCWKPGEPAPEPASLAGRYFCDENGDALDGGEPPVVGVTVELLDATGNVIATTQTDDNGEYIFRDLDAGTYSVRFAEEPTGKTFVAKDAGGTNDTDDSDVDPGTGTTDPIMLMAGENKTDVDAGVEDPGTASLGGRYFCDENDNDVDDGEPPVAGVEVALLDAAGNVVASQVTDSNGEYLFTGLDAGTYSVQFADEPTGKTFVAPNQGNDDTVDSDVDPGTGQTGPIQVNIGDAIRDVDAGVEDPGTAALKGRYFCDENDNDVDDAEPGIAGVRVVLLTVAGAVVAETTTASDGSYEFLGLDAGDYRVAFDADPTGKVFVAPDAGNDDTVDSDVDPQTGETGVIPLEIGQVVEDIDAGVEDPGTASLGDKVFLDENGNGLQDLGEAGVADVEVQLLDENGMVMATTMTDDQGEYLFDGLDAGTYSVMFVEPDGFDFTDPNAGDDTLDSDANPADGKTAQVTLAIGEENLTVDAGLVLENGAPTPVNDMGMVCANELLTIDVLGNDSDPENDTLTITEVNGEEIAEGGAALEIDGVFVSLVGGELVFDGEAAFFGLDIGETADVTFTYTVSDGMGNTAMADVDVTFCGTAETVEEVAASLPAQITYQIVDGYNNGNSDAYTVKLESTDVRLDDLIIEAAYCVSALDPAASGPDFATAPILTGDLYVADADLLPDNVLAGQVGINGQTAEENLDLVNWILNQDFESQGYTDAEVQAAIWGLTDSIDFIPGAFGDLADVREIVALAEANGEGFEAGPDGIIGLIIDPNPETSVNVQPYILGVNFNDIDCLC